MNDMCKLMSTSVNNDARLRNYLTILSTFYIKYSCSLFPRMKIMLLNFKTINCSLFICFNLTKILNNSNLFCVALVNYYYDTSFA